MGQSDGSQEQQKFVMAEWIDTFAEEFEIDAELLYGKADMFKVALQKAREMMPDRRADINHVTFQIRNSVQLSNGRCLIDLKVSAFQRF